MALIDELMELERRGWESLCDGTGDRHYREVMIDDGLMVLAHGMVMDREQVSASLAEAPPWQSFELAEERLVELPGGAALVYRASAWRDGDATPFVALMSSVYAQTPNGWRLALYQQTPVPGAT